MPSLQRAILGATIVALAGLAPVKAPAQEAGAGNADRGERVFRRCSACHTFDPDQRRPGPHLVGVIGRTAGAVEGFRYSDAMMESGIVWDDASLREYLEDPRAVVPGGRMVFRLRRAQEIEDVIAYLRRQGEG